MGRGLVITVVVSLLVAGCSTAGTPLPTGIDDSQTQTKSTQLPTTEHDISPQAVEREFLELFNEWREEERLNPVSVNPKLTDLGREHSEYMADEGQLTHEESGGRTIKHRFQKRGLLPKCEIEIRGSDRYYPGAENAAQTWIYTNIQAESGIEYYSSARELAEGLLRQWLNSPGHRKPMVQPDVKEIGLGIVITPNNKVWASLEFC